jgi:uncharacterized membrane protein YcjF (UPF0283 family)
MSEQISKDFYELCYDQYKIELEEAEKLYQKVSILFLLIPVLASVSVTIGTIDLISDVFERVDIFLYYFSFLFTWSMLCISIGYSIFCVIPRKGYLRIGDMEQWQDWRDKYEKFLKESEGTGTADEALIRDICPKLAEAQTKNAPMNEKRRAYFRKAVFWACLSIIPIGVQALFYLLLKLQGI